MVTSEDKIKQLYNQIVTLLDKIVALNSERVDIALSGIMIMEKSNPFNKELEESAHEQHCESVNSWMAAKKELFYFKEDHKASIN